MAPRNTAELRKLLASRSEQAQPPGLVRQPAAAVRAPAQAPSAPAPTLRPHGGGLLRPQNPAASTMAAMAVAPARPGYAPYHGGGGDGFGYGTQPMAKARPLHPAYRPQSPPGGHPGGRAFGGQYGGLQGGPQPSPRPAYQEQFQQQPRMQYHQPYQEYQAAPQRPPQQYAQRTPVVVAPPPPPPAPQPPPQEPPRKKKTTMLMRHTENGPVFYPAADLEVDPDELPAVKSSPSKPPAPEAMSPDVMPTPQAPALPSPEPAVKEQDDSVASERTLTIRNFPASWTAPEAPSSSLHNNVRDLLAKFGELEGFPVISRTSEGGPSAIVRFQQRSAAVAACEMLHGRDNRDLPRGAKWSADYRPPADHERFRVAFATAAPTSPPKRSDAAAAAAALAAAEAAAAAAAVEKSVSGAPAHLSMSRRLVISSLPPDWDLRDVEEVCDQYGDLIGVAPAGTGRFSATYATTKAAERVRQALDGMQVPTKPTGSVCLRCERLDPEGGELQLYFDELAAGVAGAGDGDAEPEGGDSAREVFLKNLPLEETSEEELQEWLNGFGEVDKATFMKHPINGGLTGCAYVRFRQREDAAGMIESYPPDGDVGDVQGCWSTSERFQLGADGPYKADVTGALMAKVARIRAETSCPSLTLLGDGAEARPANGTILAPRGGPLRFAWLREDMPQVSPSIRARLAEWVRFAARGEAPPELAAMRQPQRMAAPTTPTRPPRQASLAERPRALATAEAEVDSRSRQPPAAHRRQEEDVEMSVFEEVAVSVEEQMRKQKAMKRAKKAEKKEKEHRARDKMAKAEESGRARASSLAAAAPAVTATTAKAAPARPDGSWAGDGRKRPDGAADEGGALARATVQPGGNKASFGVVNGTHIVVTGFPASWTTEQVKLVFALFGGVAAVDIAPMDKIGGTRVARVQLREAGRTLKAVEKLNGQTVGDGDLIERCTVHCRMEGAPLAGDLSRPPGMFDAPPGQRGLAPPQVPGGYPPGFPATPPGFGAPQTASPPAARGPPQQESAGGGRGRRRRRRERSRSAGAGGAGGGVEAAVAGAAPAAPVAAASAEITEEIQAAISIVQEGRALAEDEQHEEAYEKYVLGLQRLMQVERRDAALQKQVTAFVEEAEKLREKLDAAEEEEEEEDDEAPAGDGAAGGASGSAAESPGAEEDVQSRGGDSRLDAESASVDEAQAQDYGERRSQNRRGDERNGEARGEWKRPPPHRERPNSAGGRPRRGDEEASRRRGDERPERRRRIDLEARLAPAPELVARDARARRGRSEGRDGADRRGYGRERRHGDDLEEGEAFRDRSRSRRRQSPPWQPSKAMLVPRRGGPRRDE